MFAGPKFDEGGMFMRAGLFSGLKVASVFSLAVLAACGNQAPVRDLEGYSAEDIFNRAEYEITTKDIL